MCCCTCQNGGTYHLIARVIRVIQHGTITRRQLVELETCSKTRHQLAPHDRLSLLDCRLLFFCVHQAKLCKGITCYASIFGHITNANEYPNRTMLCLSNFAMHFVNSFVVCPYESLVFRILVSFNFQWSTLWCAFGKMSSVVQGMQYNFGWRAFMRLACEYNETPMLKP